MWALSQGGASEISKDRRSSSLKPLEVLETVLAMVFFFLTSEGLNVSDIIIGRAPPTIPTGKGRRHTVPIKSIKTFQVS